MTLLLIFFFSSLSLLAVIHIVSLEFFLYWKYLWIDIPIHALGGVTVALGLAILPYIRVTLPARYTSLWATLSLVFIVGVVWEVFEITSGISPGEPGFVFDTLLDLCMDVLGGAVGYGIVRSVKYL
jgi:hypothetical protein